MSDLGLFDDVDDNFEMDEKIEDEEVAEEVIDHCSAFSDEMVSYVQTIMPHHPVCRSCGRSLDHSDFVRFLYYIGFSWSNVRHYVNIINIRKDCCIGEYEGMKCPTKEPFYSDFREIHKSVVEIEDECLFSTEDCVVVAASVHYLLLRGVSERVLCHLLQLPYKKLFSKYELEGDCPTCGCLVPVKDAVSTLLKHGKVIASYINCNDRPRNCCLRAIIDGDIPISPEENEEFVDELITSESKWVPAEEIDFMMCRDCGTELNGIADDSDLEPIETRAHLPHVSGDCIRRACRWGLPMEFGFICHGISRRCCRSTINNADIRIFASEELDKRKRDQITTTSVYIAH